MNNRFIKFLQSAAQVVARCWTGLTHVDIEINDIARSVYLPFYMETAVLPHYYHIHLTKRRWFGMVRHQRHYVTVKVRPGSSWEWWDVDRITPVTDRTFSEILDWIIINIHLKAVPTVPSQEPTE